MKVLHISYSDIRGGASIAAYNIHRALISVGVDSIFLCNKKFSTDDTVISYNSLVKNIFSDIKISINRKITNFFNDKPDSYSLGFFSSNLIKYIKDISPDIINLHWINNEMLSVKDISKLQSRLVWLMHDMWPFCGTEHYTKNNIYFLDKKNLEEKDPKFFFDINKWTWKKKFFFFKNLNINVVCPSAWMSHQVKNSEIFSQNKIYNIPYAINHHYWQPIEKNVARDILKLPRDEFIILFGSERGSFIPRKGFNFLLNVLNNKNFLNKKIRLVVFGGNKKEHNNFSNDVKIQFINHLYDADPSLRLLYSASDILAMPSEQECFGLIAAEAAACETPCIAFEKTGVSEIIIHKETGYLANYMNQQDFENGILWMMKDQNELLRLSKNSRKRIIELFNYEKIANEYNKIYNKL